jgi:hypothetical protein
VKSAATARFWDRYASLPEDVKRQARFAYRLFRDNPNHPGLRFKRVHGSEPIYSVRIGLGYRAVGVLQGDTVLWFWIGSHREYDRLLKQL